MICANSVLPVFIARFRYKDPSVHESEIRVQIGDTP